MPNNTIREAYQWASSFLAQHHIHDPLFEAEWMLRELLDIDRASFFLEWDKPFPLAQQQQWQQWIKRRAAHEPLQYIFGHAAFYGRMFQVTPAVLIPRPETELLVEHVLTYAAELWGDKPLRVLDIGTGSGCIPITLQLERPNWFLTTVDLSAAALTVAQQNAAAYGLAEQICFIEGSYVTPVAGQPFEIIVSNPPYIPIENIRQLDREVSSYEPHLALVGGDDGLDPYRAIIAQVAVMPDVGRQLLAFEIGDEQGEAVTALLEQSGVWVSVDVLQDMNGRDRYLIARRKEN